MSVLLHAITSATLADPPRGLHGAALEFIPTGSVGIWASPIGTAGATRDDALEHHRVVEELCERQSCLPIRFGTRAIDSQAASALLAPREGELASALERVGRRRELAVTLLWLDADTRPGRGHALVAGTPGRAFLERKRAVQVADEERRAAAEALAGRLVAELAVDQADVRHTFCPSLQVALSTAILAPAGHADALKEKVVRVASGLGGVRAVVSGPWPPYTFASAT